MQRVDISYLDESAFDWAQYSWTTPEVLVSTGKKALRPYQEAALLDVFDGLRAHDRGKLIMACGTCGTEAVNRQTTDAAGVAGVPTQRHSGQDTSCTGSGCSQERIVCAYGIRSRSSCTETSTSANARRARLS